MIKTVSSERYALALDFLLSRPADSGQGAASLVSLGAAGFLALWTDSATSSNGSVRVQRFDLNGKKLGAEIQIVGGDPHGAAGPDGGFVVTWTIETAYPAVFDIKAQRFDSSGTPIGNPITVNTITDGFQTDSRITRLANGNYVVAWNHDDGGTEHVRYQILDSNLQKIGVESIATDGVPGDQNFGDVIVLADGGFVVVWYAWGADGPRAQIFEADGSKRGGAFQLHTTTAGTQYSPTLAALPGGGFVAAWADDGNANSGQPANGHQGIWLQLYDAQGQKLGGEIKASSLGSRYQDSAAIALTATGFLVFWREVPEMYSSTSSVRGQAFDFAGSKVGEEFTVDSSSTASEFISDALTLDNGAVVVTWLNRESSGITLQDVRARILFPAQHGTGGADGSSGSSGRDFYFGHGGNDVVWGGAEDDGLSGGEGDDILNGEQGDDILDGGAGADLMTGGTGNDFYTVHEAGDVVLENAGEGTDTVETSWTDYAAPAAVENVTGTLDSGTQTLRGNALDNILTGGDADNVFHVGSGGHDVVAGAGGRDTLIIDWSDSTSAVTSDNLNVPFGDEPGATYFDGTSRSVRYSRVEVVVITTGSGNDFIRTQGYPSSAGLSTRISSGAGDDLAHLNSSLDTFDGGDGIDGVYVFGGATSEPFEWRIPSNLFLSPPGAPQLANIEYFATAGTSGGNDIVETGRLALDDAVFTGAGNDLVIVYNGEDVVYTGTGTDTLVIDWSDSTAPVQLDFEFSFDFTASTGQASSGMDRSIRFAEVERLVLRAGSAADSITGGFLADELSGGAGDDTLSGANGDDRLIGDSGNDILSGGAGADTMIGGSGDDSYYILAEDGAAFEDVIVELQGGGTDVVRTTMAVFSLAGIAEVEYLMGFANTGQVLTGNDLGNYIQGSVGGDTLIGGLGNDELVGLGGNDTMRGGLGDDSYRVEDSGDVVEENVGEGMDSVFTSLAVFSLLATHVENLVALNDIAHEFRGSAAGNLIVGGAGIDRFLLQDGGEDRAAGGAGNDLFYFGSALSAGDVADGGDGRDAIVLQGNVTAVLSETNFVGIESISIQSGANASFGDTANNFYDFDITLADGNVAAGQQLIVNAQSLRAGEDFTFDGSAESDGRFLIYGGHGTDNLTGGDGVDVFFFEGQRWTAGDKVDGGGGRDALVISGGDGLTRIEFATDSFTNIESISVNNRYATDPSQHPSYELVLHNGNVAPGGTLIVNGSSIPLGQVVNIDGRAIQDGNLVLFGGGGHDVLIGGSGADLIIGGGGQDSLTGGAGADTFRYDAVSDSPAGATDLIADFQTGTDKIDLSRIDANTTLAGDQSFTWIGASAFGGTAGQLRVRDEGGYRYLEGDTNGDGQADFAIAFYAVAAPQVPGDFLL